MFAGVRSPKERDALVREFLANREVLKQRQVTRKVAMQHQGEFFERASQPITVGTHDLGRATQRAAEKASEELAQTREAINDRQDHQIRELQEITNAVETSQDELADRLDNLRVAPVGTTAGTTTRVPPTKWPRASRSRSAPPSPSARLSSDLPSKTVLERTHELEELEQAFADGEVISEADLQRLGKAFGGGKRVNVTRATRDMAAEGGRRVVALREKLRGPGRSPFHGTGVRYYKGPDELIERLHLCCGSLQAGNDSKELKNEIEEILTTLLADGAITKDEYRAIRRRCH